MRAAWEIGFALLFLICIRSFIVTGLGGQTWFEVLTVFPDFVIWIWAFAFAVLSTGLIRMKLIFQMRRAGEGKDQKLVMDATVVRSL